MHEQEWRSELLGQPDYQTNGLDAWVDGGVMTIYPRHEVDRDNWFVDCGRYTLNQLGELADLRAQWYNDENMQWQEAA